MIEYTLLELIHGLKNHQFTSVQLVQMYLDQINKYDSHLNSIAELNPDAVSIAHALDKERIEKGPRSLVHGIPLLLKDNINTKDKMHTTANSLALSDLLAPYDATIVSKLREAGAIILGKSNLSEFAHFMSYGMPSGYGSRNGQVINPYNKKIDPLGSSTGSAVAIAANMIPVAIGTETNGSLMAPAYHNSIVAIKPTLGMVSRYGIIPISANQDTAGPMGKTVADCAILLSIIAGKDSNDSMTVDLPKLNKTLSSAYKKSVKNRNIGIIHFENEPYHDEEKKVLLEAKQKLEKKGMFVIDIVIKAKRMNNVTTLLYEFKHDLDQYLTTVSGHTKMKSLSDIIDFNQENPKERLKYGQTILEDSNKTKDYPENPVYQKNRAKLLLEANRFEEIMQRLNLDALLSTKWTSYAPIAGNPSICVPAKALIDLKPVSIVFVGKKWDDATLISIAHAYERATKHRIPPAL
jgi:amidase